MQIESSDNKNAKEVLFHHLHRNADVAALREYCKMAVAADGFPNMQQLGEKMLSELPPEGVLEWCVGVSVGVVGGSGGCKQQHTVLNCLRSVSAVVNRHSVEVNNSVSPYLSPLRTTDDGRCACTVVCVTGETFGFTHHACRVFWS